MHTKYCIANCVLIRRKKKKEMDSKTSVGMTDSPPSFGDQIQQLVGVGLSYVIPVARRMVLGSFSSSTRGRLDIKTPDGETWVLGDDTSQTAAPSIHVHNELFWLRILVFGDIGFAESYMLREISTTSLTAVFEFFIHNSHAVNRPTTAGLLSSFLLPLNKLLPWRAALNRSTNNNIATARLNATAHYSLSNDMFAAFLSPDMTYSAPIWLQPGVASGGGAGAGEVEEAEERETLEAAQLRKLRYAISAARIQASDHVLEIGTGWGSFAILAAQTTGCHVTTVTPSAEQKRLVEARIRDAGLAAQVVVVQADYRELGPMGPFDKVVSIEMIEHVGHAYLDTYFECVDRYLKDEGGIGYFQSITIPETRYEKYRHSEDFIKKYIFPGGHLPTVSGLVGSINRGSKGKLIVEEIKSVGMHYPKALRCWNENFQARFEADIKPALHSSHPEMTKVDVEMFRRKWEVSVV